MTVTSHQSLADLPESHDALSSCSVVFSLSPAGFGVSCSAMKFNEGHHLHSPAPTTTVERIPTIATHCHLDTTRLAAVREDQAGALGDVERAFQDAQQTLRGAVAQNGKPLCWSHLIKPT